MAHLFGFRDTPDNRFHHVTTKVDLAYNRIGLKECVGGQRCTCPLIWRPDQAIVTEHVPMAINAQARDRDTALCRRHTGGLAAGWWVNCDHNALEFRMLDDPPIINPLAFPE